MDTLETFGRRIETTKDLQSIVRTMKALSAVSIRQYECAVEALYEHTRAIELGLQALLDHGRPPMPERGEPEGATIAVVFGSDHGLCGRFNREVAGLALSQAGAREDTVYLVAGARAAAQLVAAGHPIRQSFPLPGTVAGLAQTAETLLLEVETTRQRRHIARVLVFHNWRSDAASATPRRIQLLPLDPGWLDELAGRRWPSRARPAFSMDSAALAAALARQHLFIALFRAAAESATSEHATRLAAMQAAERNIEERLKEMGTAFRRIRQESITSELLDVVAGFEALSGRTEVSAEEVPTDRTGP